jgi:hypothetical protein
VIFWLESVSVLSVYPSGQPACFPDSNLSDLYHEFFPFDTPHEGNVDDFLSIGDGFLSNSNESLSWPSQPVTIPEGESHHSENPSSDRHCGVSDGTASPEGEQKLCYGMVHLK